MALKLRVLTKFPALVEAATGIAVAIANGIYSFSLKLMDIAEVSIADTSNRYVILVSDADGDGVELHERVSLANFIDQAEGSLQVITAGGPQNIDATAGLVIVNQTVGAAITLTLPLASNKIGRVKIVDWKGDAGTNPITIARSGSETFNGALTSWVLGGAGASAVFTPYSANGYAV